MFNRDDSGCPHDTSSPSAGAPSQLLRKSASCPRQHEPGAARRGPGRVERTLLIIDGVLDPDLGTSIYLANSRSL